MVNNLGFIKNILDFKGLAVDDIQCLNYKSSKVVCRRCINSCPTKALQINDTELNFIEKKCVDCTACVAACPVLAIDYPRSSYSKIAQQIQTIPTVDITCQQFTKYQKGIKIPCYRLLDAALIMNWYNNQQQHPLLYTGNCSECKYALLFDMQEHLLQLREYCQQLDDSIKLTTTTDADVFLRKQTDKTTQAAEGVTRRALFQRLRPGFLDKDDSNSEQSQQQKKLELNRQAQLSFECLELDAEQKNIYKRQLLQDILTSKLKVEELTTNQKKNCNLPERDFAEVSVSDCCDYCEVCERVCPTKALYWQVGDDNVANLLFDSQKCIACQRCKICPQQAIELSSLTHEQWLAGVRVVRQMQLNSCQDCGNKYHTSASTTTSKICKWCEMEKRKKADLFNSL